jgi:glycosyltransferase involved in cell wall biosynthesis
MVSNNKTTPHICLLMTTYNGEKFLTEQLQSIENQTHQNWRLIISDDGSSDDTLIIAKKFQQKWGGNRLEILNGPRNGYSQNFLYLACNQKIQADFYAFSDQDDVWMTDKLSRAIEYFEANNTPPLPRVYCSRTKLVDENLNPIGLSPLFTLPRSFRNALVQSIAGGNTMVFNQLTKDLLEKAGRQQVISHDWWLYQITKGAGGNVFYDPEPTIFYRQHKNSVIGSNKNFKAKIKRLHYVISGRFKDWNNINCTALTNVNYLLTKDNKDILDTFITFRTAKLKDRVRLLEVCGIYRQTWQGTLSLWFATIINRI